MGDIIRIHLLMAEQISTASEYQENNDINIGIFVAVFVFKLIQTK